MQNEKLLSAMQRRNRDEGGMTQTLLGGIIEVNGKFSLTLNRDLSHSQLYKENHCFSYTNETFLQKVSSEGE